MRTGSFTAGMWHDWQLCLSLIIAMQPFRIRHLLGENRQFLAAWAAGCGVKRVAGGAQLRLLDVFVVVGLEAAGRSLHDARLAFLDVEGAVLRPGFLGCRDVQ